LRITKSGRAEHYHREGKQKKRVDKRADLTRRFLRLHLGRKNIKREEDNIPKCE